MILVIIPTGGMISIPVMLPLVLNPQAKVPLLELWWITPKRILLSGVAELF